MRVLVVRDFMKNFYPIRNCFGVFKNQPLPKKFVFCQNMREREECSYQNACLFSHSITELAIWQVQKQGKINGDNIICNKTWPKSGKTYKIGMQTREKKSPGRTFNIATRYDCIHCIWLRGYLRSTDRYHRLHSWQCGRRYTDA